MTHFRVKLSRFWRAEAGATFAEYGLLVLLVVVVAIGAVSLFGAKMAEVYSRIVQQVVPAFS